MQGGWRVRVGGPEDLEAVIALERQIPEAPHWSAMDYAAIFGGGGVAGGAQRRLFVAEGERGVLGFAVGEVVGGTGSGSEAWGELESVGVEPGARRCGVGRALCEAVLAWCRNLHVAHVELEVRSKSTGAIRLYESLGFRSVGSRFGYYSQPADDAVLMRAVD